MIRFDNWTITAQTGVVARQYDNLTRRMEVLGELPEGWTWELLVQAQGHLDILLLTPCQGGVGIDLTEGMLALAGYYAMQLRGTRGEQVRHTNQVMVYIPESLSGSANWPTVPSEFAQVEQNILTLNDNPPYPGNSGYWMIYSLETGSYVQSNILLPESPAGPQGAPGTSVQGIHKISGTGAPGTTDTYEVVLTNGAVGGQFTVYNGADGGAVNKKILIAGDSVAYGYGWTGGFSNLIAEDFPGCEVRNIAANGATLAGEQILNQMGQEIIVNGYIPDIIIFDGGWNDLINGTEIGTVDFDSYLGEALQNSQTILQMLEFLFYRLEKLVTTVQVIYFSIYKLIPDSQGDKSIPPYSEQRVFVEGLRNLCQKYGITFVDFWPSVAITPAVQEHYNTYMHDSLHINEAGYRRLWPVLKQAILNLR